MLPPVPRSRPRRKRHSTWLTAAAFVAVPLLPLLPAVAAPAHADTVRDPLAELRDDIDAILEDPSLEEHTCELQSPWNI